MCRVKVEDYSKKQGRTFNTAKQNQRQTLD